MAGLEEKGALMLTPEKDIFAQNHASCDVFCVIVRGCDLIAEEILVMIGLEI